MLVRGGLCEGDPPASAQRTLQGPGTLCRLRTVDSVRGAVSGSRSESARPPAAGPATDPHIQKLRHTFTAHTGTATAPQHSRRQQ